MLGNYLKIAFRNFLKHKSYSFINIAGLAIGMAASIVIGVYIFTEISYDKYHEKSERIYRIETFLEFGGNAVNVASTNFPAGPVLKSDYPEVENLVRLRRFFYDTPVSYDETQYVEKNVFYADPSFFDIFSFNMLMGNPKTALEKPYSIVITKAMAGKYFGDEQPIGKVLTLDKDKLYTVTGIVDNVPYNSHFTFNMLCSFESVRDIVGSQMERWMGDFQNFTYILLDDNYDYKKLEVKIPALIEKNIGELLAVSDGKVELFLQPLEKIHLYSNTLNEIIGSGDIKYIYIFSAIAFFILLIACINFLNLTTARSAIRYREVGVKKVYGAKRSQLIFQFLSESLLFSVFAAIIALLIIAQIWPLVHEYSGLEISVLFDNLNWFAGGLIALTLLVGIAAGSYPAFYLSSFHPASIVKGIKTDKTRLNYRKVLVILQFVISITLIGSTLIIINQLNYLQNKKLGFKKDNVVAVPFDHRSATRSVESLKNDLFSHPEVISVTTSSTIPGQGGTRQNVFQPEGFVQKDAPLICAINVDKDFLPTMNIELIAGRNFSDKYSTDPAKSIIINETAVKRFGWKNPLGKKVTEWIGSQPTKTVIGVVKDYHFTPLHYKIAPLIIENETNGENHRTNYFLIRIASTNINESINFIQSVLENKNSPLPFKFFFLDENFNDLYNSEMRFSRIFSYFTSIAIFLACLGLLGLAAYTAEQRTKEIGIRKVLGASIGSVTVMLSKEFIKSVVFANLIAWPVTYFAMNRWLQNFAYRINISWWMFASAGAFALGIALLTVSFQAIRAATANPVESLRYE